MSRIVPRLSPLKSPPDSTADAGEDGQRAPAVVLRLAHEAVLREDRVGE
jgi:hypothetical protein